MNGIHALMKEAPGRHRDKDGIRDLESEVVSDTESAGALLFDFPRTVRNKVLLLIIEFIPPSLWHLCYSSLN